MLYLFSIYLLFFYLYFIPTTKTNESLVATKKTLIPNKKHIRELLPNECGRRLISKSKSLIQQRISSGFHSERGDHPWQVS